MNQTINICDCLIDSVVTALSKGVVRRLASCSGMEPLAFIDELIVSFHCGNAYPVIDEYDNENIAGILFHMYGREQTRSKWYNVTLLDAERTYTQESVYDIIQNTSVVNKYHLMLLETYTDLRGEVQEGTSFFDEECNIQN